MRIYEEQAEEDLRARTLVREWTKDGLLTGEQGDSLEAGIGAEADSNLRTVPVFLRVVLFCFTLFGVAAACLLFFLGSRPSGDSIGQFLVVMGVLCYAGAEVTALQARFYRHGIEEALAVAGVGLLCGGLGELGQRYAGPYELWVVALVVGTVLSVWVWQRFGLWYALVGAMVLAGPLPGYATGNAVWRHGLLVLLFGLGIAVLRMVRQGREPGCVSDHYAVGEALLWVGVYVCCNLKILDLDRLAHWVGRAESSGDFPLRVYWLTWGLIWLLPAAMLTLAVREKDRDLLRAGLVVGLATLVSNKAYLGLARHTWDPMVLGVVLVGTVVWLRRWLAGGADGVRWGFTAARLSGRDDGVMSAGSMVLGVLTPARVLPAAQARPAQALGGDGASGGGGAGRDF